MFRCPDCQAVPAMKRDAAETLRDGLLELRRDALEQLAALDVGLLRLVADAGAVLAQIEEAAAIAPQQADRALVVDDNVTVQIVVYSADRQAACATLSPTVAIHDHGHLFRKPDGSLSPR